MEEGIDMLKILCLEDDDIDFEIINMTLEKGGMEIETRMVNCREKFLEGLTTFNPDVILSDHSLPQFNSIEALRLCRSLKAHIPFILVTGAVSDEFAVNCIKEGADDYVLKSNLNRLASAIKSALKHKETEKAKMIAMTSLASRNEELLKINAELDSLVYSVSHNLRAPLMSVLGLITLVKNETNPSVVHHYHELIEKSVHKLDDTLKEILDYSRNARLDLQIVKIDFNEIVKDTLEKLQYMSGVENINIHVSVNEEAAFYSDHYRISVIMNNLISNAIKYYDDSKTNCFFNISITVDDKKAKLLFEDNGIGIDTDALPRIFNMFFRATNKTTGSGLGLYIVKEAVEKLHGTVTIESSIGEGTIFNIEIPNQPVT
ncbi:MAG TPA: hybrid sensor histidine kinase/response regulator [Cyclobacteriaceae bacterium]